MIPNLKFYDIITISYGLNFKIFKNLYFLTKTLKKFLKFIHKYFFVPFFKSCFFYAFVPIIKLNQLSLNKFSYNL